MSIGAMAYDSTSLQMLSSNAVMNMPMMLKLHGIAVTQGQEQKCLPNMQ